ncbi:MAG TPA: PH domain-containing protein [Allosphingosinicella sp.]
MEQVLDSFRPSTLGWLIGTMAGWGTILLALAGIAMAALDVGGLGPYPLALVAVSLAILAWQWLENLAARFEVTNERLVIRRGIIMKSVDEIELYRIKDVRINFSLINQMAGIGTISIASSDETTRAADLVISNVANAQERREAMRRLVDAARRLRGVRELDMVHEEV